MKFNDVHKQQDKALKHVKINKSVEQQTQIDIIDSMFRFGSIGVYVMKNNKRGLFREIATYINDGNKPSSWALKVFHTDEWYIQFGINPNVDFENTDIFITELLSTFEEKYEYLDVKGTKKVALLSGIKDKDEAEDITNYLINMFENVELEFINSDIIKNLSQDESIKPMKITGFFPGDDTDKKAEEKFNNILDKLESIRLSSEDTNIFNIIKKRIHSGTLRDKDKNKLNSLMEDYFSTHERVSIAMKHLRKD